MEQTQVVLPCGDIQKTIDWFESRAGFRLLMIRPADDPSIAVLEGHGIQIRLDCYAPDGPTALRLVVEDPGEETLTAPNGTEVQCVAAEPELFVPRNRPQFVLSRAADANFGEGRAGMGYRDLIPERQGGRFIASHISIPTGGPVPDYVHHHRIRFQMIFCHAGWADLVYEDQGDPFRMEAGDCVLQPPHIRHRVLATSDAFEVVEIGCPAVHDTLRDHELELPNDTVDTDRDFGGQRFHWHRAAGAGSGPWRSEGFTSTDFGLDSATGGLATAGVVGATGATGIDRFNVDGEFQFWFIRSGTASLHRDGELHELVERDSVTFAAEEEMALTDVSADFSFLEVRL